MSLLESMERSTCFVALACAKKLMALTLHLFQTLQLIDLDFSAALTEMEEVQQTILHGGLALKTGLATTLQSIERQKLCAECWMQA